MEKINQTVLEKENKIKELYIEIAKLESELEQFRSLKRLFNDAKESKRLTEIENIIQLAKDQYEKEKVDSIKNGSIFSYFFASNPATNVVPDDKLEEEHIVLPATE